MNNIVAKMEIMRGNLHAVVENKGFLDAEVIKLSQELDRLIMDFYAIRRDGDTPSNVARAI